ncbi:MAG: tetraacyldisaccharide 4'-kinase, partial [Pseudobdellovibrionaceae bacterium]
MNRFLGAIPGIDLPWKTVSEIKNQLYDHSFLDSFYANKPTLSIGNLTIGGTGKTPIMLDFVRYFENDFKIAVINRSYGGSLKEPLCLDLANSRFKTETHLTTSLVGDEALLLQQGFKSASVFTGPSKSQTAQFISENDHFDFLIVDDGFQHRKLGRNCDVVILDATEPTESYQCFPRGRARESFSSLKRADLVFITKVNLAPTIQVQKILNRIEMNRSEQGVQNPLQVFQFEFLNDRIDLVTLPGSDSITQGRKEVSLNTLIGQEVTAVSAIGNPGAFEKSLKLLN